VNDILLPPIWAPPSPNAWTVTIYPSNVAIPRVDADGIWVRLSYIGGYATVPPALKMLLLRLAWWKFKLREAPLGRVAMPPFGITEIIPALPADIATDIGLWTRKAIG
jgi:hypothetical protein